MEEGIRCLYEAFNEFYASHQELFSRFTTNGNAAYCLSYKSFVEEGAELLRFQAEKFGIHDEEKDCKMVAGLFSYAIHCPTAPYEEIEAAVKKLL